VLELPFGWVDIGQGGGLEYAFALVGQFCALSFRVFGHQYRLLAARRR
jgi:hypothetical protein